VVSLPGTDISDVSAQTGSKSRYNIQGVKMKDKGDLQHGIYIVGGKKVAY